MRDTLRLATAVLAAAAGADACSLAMLSDIEAITPICCGGEEAAKGGRLLPFRRAKKLGAPDARTALWRRRLRSTYWQASGGE